MDVKTGLKRIQYDSSWEVWGKGATAEAPARYVQHTERTYILKEQGWRYIANGVEIGNHVLRYCDGQIGDEMCVEEAVEDYLEHLRHMSL